MPQENEFKPMEAQKSIWYNGSLHPWEQAHIHILSHTLHYGGGVFEGIRFYETAKGPAVFRLKEHLERLLYSAECFKMPIKDSLEELTQATLETIKDNQLKAGYIRPIAFYGYGKMGLNPTGMPVDLAIAVWPWGAYLGGKETVNVKTSSYIRIHPKSTHSEAKVIGHYTNSILASLELTGTEYDEALLLDYKGHVAEGPGENIFMVKDRIIYTPSSGSILAGITRNSVIQIARDLGYQVIEKEIFLDELKTADEMFFTGTAVEVQPIGKLDDVIINNQGIGEITKKLKDKFFEIVQGRDEKYQAWLTYVD